MVARPRSAVDGHMSRGTGGYRWSAIHESVVPSAHETSGRACQFRPSSRPSVH